MLSRIGVQNVRAEDIMKVYDNYRAPGYGVSPPHVLGVYRTTEHPRTGCPLPMC